MPPSRALVLLFGLILLLVSDCLAQDSTYTCASLGTRDCTSARSCPEVTGGAQCRLINAPTTYLRRGARLRCCFVEIKRYVCLHAGLAPCMTPGTACEAYPGTTCRFFGGSVNGIDYGANCCSE
ncbi:hypothetical protein BV898_06592 [Hypsibius exemplaris]|uniref:Uncharacterized protein n=1 Tax=Hypsibius exemplaris TaxID=2072580 RepID=A0A1W0WW42_HYPEX|nr:hypothetical protein BV898_06592 [Hypsibius exemplaris]